MFLHSLRAARRKEHGFSLSLIKISVIVTVRLTRGLGEANKCPAEYNGGTRRVNVMQFSLRENAVNSLGFSVVYRGKYSPRNNNNNNNNPREIMWLCGYAYMKHSLLYYREQKIYFKKILFRKTKKKYSNLNLWRSWNKYTWWSLSGTDFHFWRGESISRGERGGGRWICMLIKLRCV